MLKAGRLMQADSPQKLYDHPDNLFVAGSIGSPSMNIAEAMLRKDDGRITIELDRGETKLVVPDAALDHYPGAADYDGRKVAIRIRPEHFAEELERKAKSGGQEFTARFDPGNPPKVDSQIDVGVRTDERHFFDPESGYALR